MVTSKGCIFKRVKPFKTGICYKADEIDKGVVRIAYHKKEYFSIMSSPLYPFTEYNLSSIKSWGTRGEATYYSSGSPNPICGDFYRTLCPLVCFYFSNVCLLLCL